MPARFPKERRLLTREQFDRVQDGPSTRKSHTKHFLVLSAPREDGPARLGVIASRRVGSAVRRNRAKRLVRQFFRHAAGLEPMDVVVVIKAGAEELTQAEADAELAGALAKRAKAAP